jgi:hypothetical protein
MAPTVHPSPLQLVDDRCAVHAELLSQVVDLGSGLPFGYQPSDILRAELAPRLDSHRRGLLTRSLWKTQQLP